MDDKSPKNLQIPQTFFRTKHNNEKWLWWKKQCEEISKLYETKKETFKDVVDFFYFNSKDNLF